MDKKVLFEMRRLAGLIKEDATVEGTVLDLRELPNGDLQLTLGADGREELESNPSLDISDLMDSARYIGNNWDFIPDLGDAGFGLTNAPGIGYGAKYDENDQSGETVEYDKLWWYPDYQVRDPKEELIKNGIVVFTRV